METTTATSRKIPTAKEFVSSPLRNRLRLELNAEAKTVWDLIGDPARMPEYSEGLLKVDTKVNAKGHCIEYLCYFGPQSDGEKGIEHRSVIKWYEPLKGWASLDDEPNAFGLQKSLTLISLEENQSKTILTWDMHFDADDLEMNRAALEQALNHDIALRLIRRFGGTVLESFVEAK